MPHWSKAQSRCTWGKFDCTRWDRLDLPRGWADHRCELQKSCLLIILKDEKRHCPKMDGPGVARRDQNVCMQGACCDDGAVIELSNRQSYQHERPLHERPSISCKHLPPCGHLPLFPPFNHLLYIHSTLRCLCGLNFAASAHPRRTRVLSWIG